MLHEQLIRRQFSLSEIKFATGDFSDAHIIGKGGFGSVYKGLIDDGRVAVAIKRLATNSNQGKQEFVTEIETLTQLRHRNIVSLIGYCDEQREMILVYEYIANGTLAHHLFRDEYDEHSSLIKWKQCLHICIGAARGLDYLHTGSSMIHRDVKSTNILLDEDLVPKISDFGLAKHVGTINLHSHVSASVKGSFGYFDPSYFTTGRLTRESDTYAFGVVLLEVLSGRRAVDPRLGEDELCLTMWAQEKMSKGKIEQLVGSNLKGEISEDCLKTFVHVIKRCVHQNPKKRPSMTRVVVQLELALEQQERADRLITNKSSQINWSLNAFWNVVKPSGSRQKDDNHEVVDVSVVAIDVPAIPVDELKVITDNFSSKHLMEEEFRQKSVYHGIMKNGNAAAIEKFYNHDPTTDQEFLQQVSTVSRLKHENVVELVGYCVHGGLRCLAYEFSPRGSLYNILHGPNALLSTSKALSWAQRVKIAAGAAKGLAYIHQRGQIHCNIQSRNILVFDDNVAKIAGFDLSTQGAYEADHQDEATPFSIFLNQIYSSPECTLNLGVSNKSDVYSFGIVLLELLTGRKPWEIQRLVELGELEPRRTERVDDRLHGNYSQIAVAEMAQVAASCLEYEADCRPSMRSVVVSLRSLLVIENFNATNK